MKRALSVLIAIALFALPLSAFGAVKAGATCSKLGATSTYLGKKYTCVKSGKKLVWNKGVTVAVPKPIATPTPSPSQAPESSSSAKPTPTPSATQSTAPLVDYSKIYSTDDGYFTEFNDPCAFDPNHQPNGKTFKVITIKHIGVSGS